ncbi:MAG: hypothetical protein L6Q29_02410 [Candidatus Pacebacteria bacterium]|nr:hypothetical protein [Candidatus Paceibacterota bacterium]
MRCKKVYDNLGVLFQLPSENKNEIRQRTEIIKHIDRCKKCEKKYKILLKNFYQKNGQTLNCFDFSDLAWFVFDERTYPNENKKRKIKEHINNCLYCKKELAGLLDSFSAAGQHEYEKGDSLGVTTALFDYRFSKMVSDGPQKYFLEVRRNRI